MDVWRHGARGVALVLAVVASLGTVPGTAGEGRARDGSPEERAARRRWALARMDEMAGERRRCRERFREARQVIECEHRFQMRFQEYNRLYLEAARE
jgi:hypothetical protein